MIYGNSTKLPIKSIELDVEFLNDRGAPQFNSKMKMYQYKFYGKCNINPHEFEYVELSCDNNSQFYKNIKDYTFRILTMNLLFNDGNIISLQGDQIKKHKSLTF